MTTTNNNQTNSQNAKATTKATAQNLSKDLQIISGIYGITPMPSNAAILFRNKKMKINGEYRQVSEFLAVDKVKSTNSVDIVRQILIVMLANAKVREGFNSEFKVMVHNGEEVETGITMKKDLSKWLKTDCIYKSDNDGEVTKGIKLEDGETFDKTNLKVRKTHGIFTAKGEILKELLTTQAKAIVKETLMYKDITVMAQSIHKVASEKATTKKETKTA